MHVCTYAIYVDIERYTYMSIYIYSLVYLHLCRCVRVYVCVGMCVRVYVCMYTHIYTHTCVFIYTHVCIYVWSPLPPHRPLHLWAPNLMAICKVSGGLVSAPGQLDDSSLSDGNMANLDVQRTPTYSIFTSWQSWKCNTLQHIPVSQMANLEVQQTHIISCFLFPYFQT